MSAYLQITLKISDENRKAATEVYSKYREPFLSKVPGAVSKELLVRPEDVQVLHRFESGTQAADYLTSDFFANEVVKDLKPLLEAQPEVRIYQLM